MGLGRLFWTSIKLHYFCGRNIKGGLFCDFKQQVLGLGWIRRQEIFRSSKFDILKPQPIMDKINRCLIETTILVRPQYCHIPYIRNGGAAQQPRAVYALYFEATQIETLIAVGASLWLCWGGGVKTCHLKQLHADAPWGSTSTRSRCVLTLPVMGANIYH